MTGPPVPMQDEDDDKRPWPASSSSSSSSSSSTSSSSSSSSSSGPSDVSLRSIARSRFRFFYDERTHRYGYVGRPAWTPEVENVPPGPGNHRRHVIPSHLILQALTRAANDHPDVIRCQLIAYAAAYMSDSPTFSLGNTCALLEAVARHIHSNPRNLWPGLGPENTVIGFVGHDIETLLRGIDRSMQQRVAPASIINQVLSDLLGLVPGLFPDLRREALSEIRGLVLGAIAAEPPSRALPIMRDLLQDIRDSLDFDLSQLGSWRAQNEQAIALYGRFQKFVESSHGSFWDLVHDFMMLDNPMITMATLVQSTSASSSSSSAAKRKHS